MVSVSTSMFVVVGSAVVDVGAVVNAVVDEVVGTVVVEVVVVVV